MAGLTVSGCGSGGISEISSAVDPETITFGLVRVPVGSGVFKREKLVFLYFNLDSCSGIKRARLNTKKGEVKKALGEVAAEIAFADLSEVSLDNVLQQLGSVLRVDSSEGGGTVSKMKEEYEAMLAKNAKPKEHTVTTVALTRKTAAEMGAALKSEDVMKSLREPMGAFNWAVFKPTSDAKLDFVNGGSLSVPEMSKWLKDDELLCGIVRLAFGKGRFRRVKWAYLTWSGPSAGAVKRAKAMSSRAPMKSKLGPVSVDLETGDRADITLDAVIDKVKRAAVVDGDEVESGDPDAFSLEKFLEALTEEARANAAFFGDSGLVLENGGSGSSADTPWSARTAAEVVAEMRRPGTDLNWALFTYAV